jgi:hypothetical protein
MDETIKRVKKLRDACKNSKHAKIVLIEGQPHCFVRWKGMSNDNRWYRYGMDVEKTIDQLVRGAALAYLPPPYALSISARRGVRSVTSHCK